MARMTCKVLVSILLAGVVTVTATPLQNDGESACGVGPSARVECGWFGINEETCLARGCCWDSGTPNAKYCFVKNGIQMPPEMCPIKPTDREDCGHFGITKDECVEKGCCWDPTVPNTKFCYYKRNVGCYIYHGVYGECRYSCLPEEKKAYGKGECKGTICCYNSTSKAIETTASTPEMESTAATVTGETGSVSPTESQCAISASKRVECGWFGINEDTCLARGCCWDSGTPNAKYCFVKNGTQMPPEMCPIKPTDREDCGYFGITKDECLEKGCCWDPTVPNTKFCYHKRGLRCRIYHGVYGQCRYSCLPEERKMYGMGECKGTICCYTRPW